MAKKPAPPTSTKLPRKLPEDHIARGVAIVREATERDTRLTAGRSKKIDNHVAMVALYTC